MDMKQIGPAPLDPKVTERLLDLLSTDDQFRELFKRDARAALLQAGHVDEPGCTASPAICMEIKAGANLPSKSAIVRERAKLEKSLSLVQRFEFWGSFQAS